MALTLDIVTISTRPGRKGPAVAAWAADAARRHGAFDVVAVDLAAVGLPLFDEPEHPIKGQYRHDHTKRWSALVSAADAFVFVTPEYNFLPPPSFVNAIDFLAREWHYKPAAFVSYGGMSGGIRAVQAAKPLLTTVKMMPIPEAVAIPGFFEHLTDDGFQAKEGHETAATLMLGELAKWAGALKPLRA